MDDIVRILNVKYYVNDNIVLDNAENIIKNYFMALKARLENVIRYSRGTINIEFGNGFICKMSIEDECLKFERRDNSIKVLKSEPTNIKEDYEVEIDGVVIEPNEVDNISVVNGKCVIARRECSFSEDELTYYIIDVFKQYLK